jgi:hypothetical protein
MIGAIAASATTLVSSLRQALKSDFCPNSRAGMPSTVLSVERRPQERPKRPAAETEPHTPAAGTA